MSESPILFSAPMVRAILEGRKTQTRRVVKPQPDFISPDNTPRVTKAPGLHPYIPCPYGQPGDRLWVRETWGLHSYGDETNWLSARGAAITKDTLALWDLAYRADFGPMQDDCHWRPSIHMPRWACRINLEIVAVRVERLQDTSEADARAEGAPFELGELERLILGAKAKYRSGFVRLWQSINGEQSWHDNPWVWVVEFKRVAP